MGLNPQSESITVHHELNEQSAEQSYQRTVAILPQDSINQSTAESYPIHPSQPGLRSVPQPIRQANSNLILLFLTLSQNFLENRHLSFSACLLAHPYSHHLN